LAVKKTGYVAATSTILREDEILVPHSPGELGSTSAVGQAARILGQNKIERTNSMKVCELPSFLGTSAMVTAGLALPNELLASKKVHPRFSKSSDGNMT
jgi:hypothetical protein